MKYLINILFINKEKKKNIFSGNAFYNVNTTKQDTVEITNKNIKIILERNKNYDLTNIMENELNAFHMQTIKTLLFYYASVKKFYKIKSINIELHIKSKINKIELNQYKQVLNNNFSINYNFQLNTLKNIFQIDKKSHAITQALSHFLNATTLTNSNERFEKLWKSFNAIYRYVGNTNKETDGHIAIRKFLLNNSNNFLKSTDIVKNYSTELLRKKLRLRELIKNDYEFKNHTISFVGFIYRYTDYRISELIKQTLVYREKHIKDIFSIKDAKTKFSNLGLNTLYSKYNTNSDKNCVYNEILTYLESNIQNNVQRDIELVAFLCIKYSYFIRNKIFHAERHDYSFTFIQSEQIEELDWINKILETLIFELIDSNNLW